MFITYAAFQESRFFNFFSRSIAELNVRLNLTLTVCFDLTLASRRALTCTCQEEVVTAAASTALIVVGLRDLYSGPLPTDTWSARSS